MTTPPDHFCRLALCRTVGDSTPPPLAQSCLAALPTTGALPNATQRDARRAHSLLLRSLAAFAQDWLELTGQYRHRHTDTPLRRLASRAPQLGSFETSRQGHRRAVRTWPTSTLKMAALAIRAALRCGQGQKLCHRRPEEQDQGDPPRSLRPHSAGGDVESQRRYTERPAQASLRLGAQ